MARSPPKRPPASIDRRNPDSAKLSPLDSRPAPGLGTCKPRAPMSKAGRATRDADKDSRLGSLVAECIISLLEEGPPAPAGWRDMMDELGREWGPEAYSVLLFVLTHHEFTASKAREHWDRVLTQWEQLNASVAEGVD